jgi:hypothetical protein
VISLRLPPRADSDPPEAVPRPFRTMLRLRRGNDRPLSGRLVISTLIGSASLRALYGFLLLFFAFAIRAGDLATSVFGRDIGGQGAVALVGGALAVGTFLSTAIGTRLRIRRPLALQSSGLTLTAGVGVLAVIFYNLPMVALLALVTAIFSGISKLAIDASIQERVPERMRASAFAHSETVLMMAWVVGGGVGIIRMDGRLGVIVAALFAVAAAVRAGFVAARLHNERLQGRPDATAADATAAQDEAGDEAGDGATGDPAAHPADPWPDAPTVAPRPPVAPAPRGRGAPAEPTPARVKPSSSEPTTARVKPSPGEPTTARVKPSSGEPTTARVKPSSVEPSPAGPDPTLVEPVAKRRGFLRRKPKAAASPEPAPKQPAASDPAPPPVEPDRVLAPPGYHVYRPSSAGTSNGNSRSDQDNP